MTIVLFDKVFSECDHLRKIKLIKSDRAVINPTEGGIKSTTNIDN